MKVLVLVFTVGSTPILVSGCGAGLVVAGVLGGLGASDDGGASPSGQVFLDPDPARADLQAAVGPSLVPICYRLSGVSADAVTSVRVEFADASLLDPLAWQEASAAAETPLEVPCGSQVFWWDAAQDLPLQESSHRVRVRLSLDGDSARADVSGWFQIGNTPPGITLVGPTEGRERVDLQLFAQDQEDDRIEQITLEYRVHSDDDECAPSELHPTCGQPILPEPDGDGWRLLAPLDGASLVGLESPSDVPARYVYSWQSRCAPGVGNGDHDLVELRATAVDRFGRESTATLELALRNNRPPQARFLTTGLERDLSFEIPVRFEVRDADGDELDIALQFVLDDEPFPDLSSLRSSCLERRRILNSDDELYEAMRRQLAIIRCPGGETNDGADPGCGLVGMVTSAAVEGEAAPWSSYHAVWDSSADLGPRAEQRVRLRLTAFDARSSESDSVDLTVQNSLLPQIDLLGAEVIVAGVASGDINGDSRPDLALSYTRSVSDVTGGVVSIFLQRENGSYAQTPNEQISLVDDASEPGSIVTPLALALVDLNLDGAVDLVALDSRCSPGVCQEHGRIAIFFNREGANGRELPQSPSLVLPAGRDVRDMRVDDLDGDGLKDIAVTNHDDADAWVYFASAPGVYSGTFLQTLPFATEPGLIATGDFDGDGAFELVLRLRREGRVLIYRHVITGALALWRELRIDTPVAVATADFDGDGELDLAIGQRQPPMLHVVPAPSRLPRSVEVTSLSHVRSWPTSASPEYVVPVKLLDTASPFLASLQRSRNRVGVFRVPQAGEECSRPEDCAVVDFFLPIPGEDANVGSSGHAADLDGDGREDLILGSSSHARLAYSRGAGSLAESQPTLEIPLEPEQTPLTMISGHLDGDDLADVAVGFTQAEPRSRYAVHVYTHESDGRLARFPFAVLDVEVDLDELQDDVFLAIDRSPEPKELVSWLAVSRGAGLSIFKGSHSSTRNWEREVDFLALPGCDGVPGEHAAAASPLQFGDIASPPGRELIHFHRNRLHIVARDDDRRLADRLVPLCVGGILSAVQAADLNGDGASDLSLMYLDGLVEIRLQRSGREWPASFDTVDLELSSPVPLFGGRLRALNLSGYSQGRRDLLMWSPEADPPALFGLLQGEPAAAGELGSFSEVMELYPLTSEEESSDRPVILSDVTHCDLTGDGREDLTVGIESSVGGTLRSRLAVFHFREGEVYSRRPSRSIEVAPALTGRLTFLCRDLTGDGRSDLAVAVPSAEGMGNHVALLRTR